MDDSTDNVRSQGHPDALAESDAIQVKSADGERWAAPDVHASIFRDVHALSMKVWTPAWSDFVARIKNPKLYATKAAMPLVMLAQLGDARTDAGSLRHEANMLAITGVALDYDDGELTIADAATLLIDAGITGVFYSSPSSTPERPRWRLLLPTSRELEPQRHRELVGRANAILGGVLAPESFRIAQSYYIGRADDAAHYETQEVRGHRCIDQADDIEPLYPIAGNGEARPNAAAQALDDPVLVALGERGMLRREVKQGAYAIHCPWESEHTGETTDSATVYLQANFEGRKLAGFKCQHAHCAHRTLGDLRDHLGLKERPAANARAPEASAYQPAALSAAEPEQWPEPLATEAFHGIAGEFVRMVEPDTESDPAAMLLHVLVAFGALVGRGPHYKVEGDEHHAALYIVLVGRTSKARKGTSWSRVREVYARIPGCPQQVSGISTGEGLIERVRDPGERRKRNRNGEDIVEIIPGVEDKRLLVIEPEFARVLRVAQRETNTLSATTRQLWDWGSASTLTRHDPISTTGAHIAIVGHITVEELRAELTATDTANGFANRFLFVAAKRSQLLPFGGAAADPAQMNAFAARLAEHAETARSRSRIGMTPAAREIWIAVYSELSAGGDGLHGAVTARAEAQVCRLALVYALLDGAAEIDAPHLLAAIAVWEYCDETAKYIFGASLGDRVADEIMRRLEKAGVDGLTRTDIRDLFGRNQPADRIGAALDLLRRRGRATCEAVKTEGRPSEVWRAAK